MFGESHSDETRAKMSDALTGANHPMFGKVAANAMTIYIYSLDGTLINSFSSQVAAAEWLGVSNVTVHNYIKSGKVWNKLYTFRAKSSSSKSEHSLFIYLFFLLKLLTISA